MIGCPWEAQTSQRDGVQACCPYSTVKHLWCYPNSFRRHKSLTSRVISSDGVQACCPYSTVKHLIMIIQCIHETQETYLSNELKRWRSSVLPILYRQEVMVLSPLFIWKYMWSRSTLMAATSEVYIRIHLEARKLWHQHGVATRAMPHILYKFGKHKLDVLIAAIEHRINENYYNHSYKEDPVEHSTCGKWKHFSFFIGVKQFEHLHDYYLVQEFSLPFI